MIFAIAQVEWATVLERQREGIEQAKKAGKYKGRAPKHGVEQIATLRARCVAGDEEKAAVARSLGISRATLYRHLGGDNQDASTICTEAFART